MKKRAKRESGVAPAWNRLTLGQKESVAKKMLRAYLRVGRFAAGRYNVVSGNHTSLRYRPQIETTGEDGVLTATLRNQFINLARNGVRNNETLNGLLNQFDVNVIGTEGGKASFDFGTEYEESAAELKRRFADWCENAEFFDRANFSEVLSCVLRTLLIGGQVALVFDDGVTSADSGRIIAYEPDCIANLKEAEFAKHVPKGWTQSNGRIRNADSVFCGVIVSHAERGKTEFEDPAHCYMLTCDPSEKPNDCFWKLVQLRYRFNQGGGKSPLTAPLGSLIDVEMLQGFEVESAKKNAQTLAQLYQTAAHPDGNPELSDPAADIGEDADFADADDATVDAAVEEAKAEQETVSFDEIKSAGCIYEVMPENSKLELLDTKHPNPNMNEFIRLVACRGGWALGISSMYTTGRVDSSYSGYRGEQKMSWKTFRRWQSLLEREVCDWALTQWAAHAERTGGLDGLNLPDGWRRLVKWSWPVMDEVDAVKEQAANNAGLKNGTRTYAEILGPDWKAKLRERAEERDYLRGLGFPDPSDETVSGQRVETSGGDVGSDEDEGNQNGGESAGKDGE